MSVLRGLSGLLIGTVLGLGSAGALIWALPPEADAEKVEQLASLMPFAAVDPGSVQAEVRVQSVEKTIVQVQARVTMFRTCSNAVARQSIYRVLSDRDNRRWLRSVEPVWERREREIQGGDLALIAFTEIIDIQPPLEAGAYITRFLINCMDRASLPIRFSTSVWYVGGGADNE